MVLNGLDQHADPRACAASSDIAAVGVSGVDGGLVQRAQAAAR